MINIKCDLCRKKLPSLLDNIIDTLDRIDKKCPIISINSAEYYNVCEDCLHEFKKLEKLFIDKREKLNGDQN